MALAVVASRALLGVQAPAIAVEVHLSGGLPATHIVGMPETAVKESKDRVRAAIINANLRYPDGRIVVNLAPADLPKEGSRFDLAIALGILVASGQVPGERLAGHEFLGELALSGQLRAIHGVLPAAIRCGEEGRTLVADNAGEAALAQSSPALAAGSLLSCRHLRDGEGPMTAAECPVAGGSGRPALGGRPGPARRRPRFDLAHVRGQRAPGGRWNRRGRAQHVDDRSARQRQDPAASCLHLPPLTEAQALAVAAIASVAGQPPRLGDDFCRPDPRTAPHRLGRGPGRWRWQSASGGDSLSHRRVVPGDRMAAQCVEGRQPQSGCIVSPGARQAEFRQFPAAGSHEPVQWLRRRQLGACC